MNKGKIVQIIGAVIDVEFDEELPALYNALKVKREGQNDLTLEVAQHIGDDVVRCIAMSSTDGLTRGMEVIDTGDAIKVPVGEITLGRLFNVTGEAVDNKEELKGEVYFVLTHMSPVVYEKQIAHLGKLLGKDFASYLSIQTRNHDWTEEVEQFVKNLNYKL